MPHDVYGQPVARLSHALRHRRGRRSRLRNGSNGMPRVDIDPQRTVTLVVPHREALLANGFNDTAGVSADIDMIISKISHISVFLFLPFEKEILSCINNSSFAGYLCVIKTILIPLLQEGGE